MKTSELKKIIKESVKEAINEELKDILLEAVKSPKVISQSPSVPVPTQPQIPSPTAPQMTLEQKRDAYKNILGETAASFTSNDAQNFVPPSNFDSANGQLPEGNLGMNQIMGLLNRK